MLLLGIELFMPGGFYLLFFGGAALLVGLLAAAGLASALIVQLVLFIVLSIAGILGFRRALVGRFGRTLHATDVDSLTGTSAVALEDLPPGAAGKVELRGTSWTARNCGGILVARGQRCTVERVEGLTLWVRIAAEEYLAATQPARPELTNVSRIDGLRGERPAPGQPVPSARHHEGPRQVEREEQET